MNDISIDEYQVWFKYDLQSSSNNHIIILCCHWSHCIESYEESMQCMQLHRVYIHSDIYWNNFYCFHFVNECRWQDLFPNSPLIDITRKLLCTEHITIEIVRTSLYLLLNCSIVFQISFLINPVKNWITTRFSKYKIIIHKNTCLHTLPTYTW